MFGGKWHDGSPIKFAKGQEVRVLRSTQFAGKLVTICYPLQKVIGKFYSCSVDMGKPGEWRATFAEVDLAVVGEPELPEEEEPEEKPGMIARFLEWLGLGGR